MLQLIGWGLIIASVIGGLVAFRFRNPDWANDLDLECEDVDDEDAMAEKLAPP